MFRLVETIKLDDGKFYNLDLHNKRFNNTREELFKIKEHINLMDYLKVREFDKSGLFKCRIVYSEEIHYIEFVPYVIRQVKSLKLVNTCIDYSYKYEDRKDINDLLKLHENCDDILMVKYDKLTDTSAANIAFFDNNRWYTPACPLLKGVKREELLQNKTIFEEELRTSDLKKFHKAAIISTMVDFGELIIPVSNIY